MDWESLRIFLQVAEQRSLSAASAGLRLSVPTIARRIEALERQLGVTLIRRTPRGLSLTEAGAALRREAQAGRDQMAALERFASTLPAAALPSPIRISATEPVAAEILAPRLGLLFQGSTQDRIVLRIDNARVSLALNDADIAIRLARPEGDSLMAKRLPPLAMALYGSEAYVATLTGHGTVDLGRATFVGYDDSYGRIAERSWIEENGFAAQARCQTSSTRAMVNAAAAGHGLAVLPRLLAEARGGLVEVRAPALPVIPERHVWIVWHRDLHRQPAIRRAVRWIEACFAAAYPSVPSAGKVSSSQ